MAAPAGQNPNMGPRQ